MNPRVSKVSTTRDYQLNLTFTNGEVGIYDCSNLLDFGVFKELKNKHYFNQAKVVDGTVVWPHEQDICPDTLYLESERTDAQQALPHETMATNLRRDSL